MLAGEVCAWPVQPRILFSGWLDDWTARLHSVLRTIYDLHRDVVRLGWNENYAGLVSMSGPESWFATLKNELGERFESGAHAKQELFEYIEVFYNQQRMHSAIGYTSPSEFEAAQRIRQVA